MPKKLSEEEYYRTLPRKQVGAGVLLFNSNRELLIVKPDYRDCWLIPGGTVDENESPAACALRETQEEIGITLSEVNLAGVRFAPAKGIKPDALLFLFDGGVLTDAQISSIRLQEDEIEEYRFLPSEEGLSLLSQSLQACIPKCLEAIKQGTVAYIETDVR